LQPLLEPEHVAFDFRHAFAEPAPACPDEPPAPLAPAAVLPPVLVPPLPVAPPLVPLAPALLLVVPALAVAPPPLLAPALLDVVPPLALLVPACPPVPAELVVPAPELSLPEPPELEHAAASSRKAGRTATAEGTRNGCRREKEFMAVSGKAQRVRLAAQLFRMIRAPKKI